MNTTCHIAAPLVLLTLAACGQQRSFPITGQTLAGQPATGQVVAKEGGAGQVSLAFPGGLTCKGSYDWRDRKPVFSVPLSCNDGATGTGVVKRMPQGIRGTATVQLSNGVRGQFVYGDLSYDEAYGPKAR